MVRCVHRASVHDERRTTRSSRFDAKREATRSFELGFSARVGENRFAERALRRDAEDADDLIEDLNQAIG